MDIKVDFNWAYDKVISSYDFSGKTPSWIEAFFKGWIDGYLEGFLIGYTEETIRAVGRMKQIGLSSDDISKCADLSLDVVNLVISKSELPSTRKQ